MEICAILMFKILEVILTQDVTKSGKNIFLITCPYEAIWILYNMIVLTGPVGSIIYVDLYGSMKIKFTVLIRNTDQ